MANPARLKYNFGDDAAREERRRMSVHELRLDFTDRWGEAGIIDLTILNDRPHLAHSVALVFFDLCEPDGSIKRVLTIKSYEKIIKGYFWPFLSVHESQGNPRILKSQDIYTSTLEGFIDWLRLKNLKSRTSYGIFSGVSRIFKYLIVTYPELVDATLEVPKYPSKGVQDSITHRAPYSEREALKIEQAALKEIRSTILRLKQGSELLSKGKDPRGENNWKDKGNLLWYVKNVLGGRYLMTKQGKDSEHKILFNAIHRIRGCSKIEIYGYLYPLIADLIPPLIFISLKTGFNPQPAIDLRRNCLKAVPPSGKIGITATKHRTGSAGPKTSVKIVDNRSTFSPGGIIRTFLSLTEPCIPFMPATDRDYLWTGFQPGPMRTFKGLPKVLTIDSEVRKFAARNGLIEDNGQPLQLRLSRLRNTFLTKRYKAAGNLAAVSKDANHARTSTTRGYVNNDQTLSIHEQTIADGLYEFYNSMRGRVLTQPPDDPVQIANVAQLIETTLEQAESMLRGEQDTFISTCKDFYNRPNGPANTPCDRPWACFPCKNAYWTSRTLPRLLCFLNFVIEQRRLLMSEDWKAKFGLPYEVITKHILPAFPPEVVNEARVTAEAEQFIVPFTLKII